MKKLLFTFLILLLAIGLSFGQIGIRAGANMANVNVDPEPEGVDIGSVIGFHVGATYDLELSDNLKLRPGLLYSTKGAKVTAGTEEFTVGFGYIEVPIGIMYDATTDGKGFFADVGPYIGMLMSADQDGEDIKETLKSVDFGVNVGVGYMVSSSISVGVHYGLGLANIDDEDADQDLKNTNIGIYGIYHL